MWIYVRILVVLILRTYALWGKNRRIAAGLFIAFTANIVVACVYVNKFLIGVECKSFFIWPWMQLTYSKILVMESPSPSAFPGCFIYQASTGTESVPYLSIAIFELSTCFSFLWSRHLRNMIISPFHCDFSKVTSWVTLLKTPILNQMDEKNILKLVKIRPYFMFCIATVSHDVLDICFLLHNAIDRSFVLLVHFR
jgi:hypothetical protein